MNNIKKVTLPTNGLLEGIPKEVTIRGMKGREISTLFSSLTEAAIDAIIKEVTDPSLDPDELCDEDKRFVLHQTRILTFGNELVQTLRCPFCGKIHEYIISYDDLEFNLLDEDSYTNEIKMKDGKVITKKIPSKVDWDKIYRYKEKRNLPETYSYLLLQVAKIKEIDGKVKSLGEIVEYLEDLYGDEIVKLSEELDMKFGLDTSFKVECKSCKTDFTGGIGISADLFR